MEESKSHLDKFTGIYDRNGRPIHNGDEIKINDKYSNPNPIMGTVIWKNGSYVFKGNHWCEYNIYAWRDSIEVINIDRESIYDLEDIENSLLKYSKKYMPFSKSNYNRLDVMEAFRAGAKLLQRNTNNATT